LTGRDKEFEIDSWSLTKNRLKNAGIEDVESKLMRKESPYLSAFRKHIAFVQQQQNSGLNKTEVYREAHPYNIMVIQSHMLSKSAIVKSI
jgi:hypothetical protein